MSKENNLTQLDNDTVQEVKEAFHLFAQDGKIHIREIKATFRALGVPIKKAEIRELLLHMFDKKSSTDRPYSSVNKTNPSAVEASTSVTYKEFLEIATPKLLNRVYQEEMSKVFQLIDEEDTGKISFESLKQVSLEVGECYTDEELKEMIHVADLDGDGALNENEFYRVMKKASNNPLDELDSDDD